MNKLHFAAALACALPALAQASTPPAPPVTPVAASPTDAAPPTDTAAPAPAAPPSIAQIVANDFPTYDVDKSGELNKAEFSTWIMAAKKQSGAEAPNKNWLSKAFAKADNDKNNMVSANELTTFLSS
jgi:hypothetical protein